MKKRIFSCFLFLAGGIAYGGQAGPTQSYSFSAIPDALKQGHFVFQAGSYWPVQGKTQHININTLSGDTFTVTEHNKPNGLVGVGYLVDGQDFSQVQLGYDVNFYYLPKTFISGLVIQEDVFTNLSYHYGVTHYPVYFGAKATTHSPIEPLSLTFGAGIGPNFMRTSGFTERSLDGITVPDNIFAAHNTTTFSATANVELEWAHVFGDAPLACGYRFFYLGKGRLTRNNPEVLDSLSAGNIYANAIVCGIRI